MRYRLRFQEVAEYEVEVEAPEGAEALSDAQLFALVDEQQPGWFKEPDAVLDRQFLTVFPVENPPLLKIMEKDDDEEE